MKMDKAAIAAIPLRVGDYDFIVHCFQFSCCRPQLRVKSWRAKSKCSLAAHTHIFNLTPFATPNLRDLTTTVNPCLILPLRQDERATSTPRNPRRPLRMGHISGHLVGEVSCYTRITQYFRDANELIARTCSCPPPVINHSSSGT
jgi:hypothetical protein